MRRKKKKEDMYGKFHHDIFEFHKALHELFSDFFEKHNNLEMKIHNDIVDLRNKVVALLSSWIGSKKIEKKFGIEISLHSTPPDIESFLKKQSQSFQKVYELCEICGEKRITNYCHIIPSSEGGPDNKRNNVSLCPTHHHLFDHNRLNKNEWEKLNFSGKLKSAREYALKIRLPLHKKFWKTEKNQK